jgi:hypothetical protein
MPRVSRPWFRFYTETFGDRKILRLTPAQRWLWAAILGAARQSPEPGVLLIAPGEPMTTGELARYADVRERDVEPALQLMESLGMIDGRNPITVPNFSHRQYESDCSTPRTRALRKRQETDEWAS